MWSFVISGNAVYEITQKLEYMCIIIKGLFIFGCMFKKKLSRAASKLRLSLKITTVIPLCLL